MTMVVFSLFFGRLAQVPSDDLPYPIFSYAALVPWTFFANGLNMSAQQSSRQYQSNKEDLLSPAWSFQLLPYLRGVVDFFLAFIVLLGMMLYFGIVPTGAVIWLPFLLDVGFYDFTWSWAMAISNERTIPRHSLHCTFYCPVLDVCDAHRLS